MKTPCEFLAAARAPESLKPQAWGVWEIERRPAPQAHRKLLERWLGEEWVGWPSYTLLRRVTLGSLHRDGGEIVMEDSRRELSRHLPIWLSATGRVLLTGLGLGCVARGLLSSPAVERVDVIEIDDGIIDRVGREFRGNSRIRLIHGDALKVDPAMLGPWDFAWHDIWTDRAAGEPHLDVVHLKLLMRFREHAERQGAWQMARFVKRRLPWLVGGSSRRSA